MMLLHINTEIQYINTLAVKGRLLVIKSVIMTGILTGAHFDSLSENVYMLEMMIIIYFVA